MDTIEVRLDLVDNVTLMDLDLLKVGIVALKSPFGHRYCDLIEVLKGRDRGLIIKISYPRYYYGNNAYLIAGISECINVQKHFVNFIQEDTLFKEIVSEIKLTRVDIPFTYYMKEGLDFNSYANIYRIFAFVYNTKKKNARAKGYKDLIDDTYETVVYSDNGKTDKSSNNRLMIYNQYQNLKIKLGKEEFENTLEEYPDLIFRMRLEVSKRIRRKEFSLDEFKEFDILSEYFQSYKEYILKNVLDMKIIDNIYNKKIIELAEILFEERKARDFKYEVFILKYLDDIHDYGMLRRALKIVILNDKTRENAVTKIRKVLIESEEREEVVIMDTYSIISEMRSYIENLEIDD